MGGWLGGWPGSSQNNATPWLHLARFARFSSRLRIQDGAECGNNLIWKLDLNYGWGLAWHKQIQNVKNAIHNPSSKEKIA